MNIPDELGPRPSDPRDLRIYRISAALLGERRGLRPADVARQLGDKPHLAYMAKETLSAIQDIPCAQRRLDVTPDADVREVIKDVYLNTFLTKSRAKQTRRRKQWTHRNCLGCGRQFKSEGAHNRLCKNCRPRATADPTGGDFSIAY